MVKKTGKKDFSGGLNSLIQSTVVVEEPEILGDIEDQGDVVEASSSELATEPEPKKGKVRKRVEKEVNVTFTITPTLRKTIKKYCVNNDITMKELFIKSVTDYMKG